ncbi:hypothetical protein QFZ98_007509 [Paraburkholderia youngii]
MHRRLDDVLEHVHVGPQVEVLEHHRKLGAHALQLFRVRHAQRAVFGGLRAHFLAVDENAPRVRLFEKVDAAKHRALAGAGRTDHADHVAGIGIQRHALEDFVVAVLFVKLVDEELLLLGVHQDP